MDALLGVILRPSNNPFPCTVGTQHAASLRTNCRCIWSALPEHGLGLCLRSLSEAQAGTPGKASNYRAFHDTPLRG
jgi:hypothetical protein